MKVKLFLFLFPFLFLSMFGLGQTIINPGDLVILGVDANLGGNPDEISFACFKDITTGTEIQITDQGYERCYAGLWGSNEGGAKLTRTGGTIPAGTVITFRTAQPTAPYIVFTYPDTLWTAASLGVGVPANSFNLNSGGDQVFIAQGGTWTPDTLCSNHYPGIGGKMLFAFSTSGSWISLGNSTQQSGLYPGMSCYNMVAPSGASDFVKYIGPLTAATQKDWITRIATITNWFKYTTSALYISGAPDLHSTLIPIIPGTDADWTSPAPLCQSSSSINLNSLISGLGLPGGTWSGTGVTGNIFNPTGLSGAYNITYTIDCPCCISQTHTITVTNPTATASSNSALCEGQNLNLTSSGGVTYSWNGPNGYSSTAQNPTISGVALSDAGTYIVTVTDAGGCSSTAQTTVVINANPSGNASSNSAICEGQDLNLTSSGGTTYIWSGPNGFSSSLQNPTITGATIAASGTYTVTVTNASSCSDVVQTVVTINPNPSATASGDSAICEGQTLHLTSSGGATYSWSGPNGFSSASQNPTIPGATLTASGTYTVTVTNAGGCSDVVQAIVIINSSPTATASSNSALCEGQALNLTSSGGTTYNWSGPNSFLSSAQNPTITGATISAMGTYTVIVTNTGGCYDTASVAVSVFPLPTANAGNDTTIIAGGSAQLSGSGGVTYSWSPSNGLSCTNCFNPIATPSVSTTYILEVTDANGCTAIDTVRITVQQENDDCAEIVIPNAFTPDGDGVNDIFRITGTAIASISGKIFNRWGQELFTWDNVDEGWDGKFNGTLVSSGTYFCVIDYTCSDGTTKNVKGSVELIK